MEDLRTAINSLGIFLTMIGVFIVVEYALRTAGRPIGIRTWITVPLDGIRGVDRRSLDLPDVDNRGCEGENRVS